MKSISIKTLLAALVAASALVYAGCRTDQTTAVTTETLPNSELSVMQGSVKGNLITSTLSEGFESGTKTSYTAANVVLSTGTWNLSDALLGNSSSDPKNGTQSARVRNSGTVTMQFDRTTGAGTVSISHAKYGTDGTGTWGLWYSTNGGSTWTQTGSSVSTTSTTLQTATFTVNLSGSIRFQIKKTDGGTNRINFDDVTITDYSGVTNPVPTVTTLSPNSATAGASAFTLTVTGTNFISGSVVNWNGVGLTTTYVSGTSLTASVPASNVAAAGTASVTVFNPAPGGGTSSAATFTINSSGGGSGKKKFLFDATKGETLGNADWVLDEDGSTPQRYPTPDQSTVTATTAENYWTGALSSWGIALVKLGNTVETLPSGTAITYGNATNPQDLSHYDVYVIDEPNIAFTASEKTAIMTFVKNGGGLMMISDHAGADRNNDGWDPVHVWNDLIRSNSVQPLAFGFLVDSTNISETTSNVLSGANPVVNGSQGAVTQLKYSNGATITLDPTKNATVKGLIWRSSSSQGNTNVMCASSTFGSGRVVVIGDSSPADDGTGGSGNTLYPGWTDVSGNHARLHLNASLWLAKLQ